MSQYRIVTNGKFFKIQGRSMFGWWVTYRTVCASLDQARKHVEMFENYDDMQRRPWRVVKGE